MRVAKLRHQPAKVAESKAADLERWPHREPRMEFLELSREELLADAAERGLSEEETHSLENEWVAAFGLARRQRLLNGPDATGPGFSRAKRS